MPVTTYSAPNTITDASTPIAIVGIGCRFPGGVTDVAGFWQLLADGVDAIREIPADRIDLAHFYDEKPATPGRIMTRWGGFLDQIDRFDAGFFGISPREAERLDPAQRLVLETAWEGLEDAGIDVNALDGSRTGVFVGQWLSDFEARLFADPETVDFHMTTGSGRYCTSGRLSYLLGLQGPSLTVDTACSSSLVAIHLAVRSLRSGESMLALAGGVNVILQPHISVAYSQSRMMAPDGRCKFGDASADGYVRSEGAGMVVLKTLAQAQADGDRIYAVIRGSAVNNDGHGSGSMGTPNRGGQEALLRTAYRDAGVAPGEVGYVEAHGTGTRAGDPVELGALGAVLGERRPEGQRALVGSAKTNFGHTEGAAGVAGLIKLALALHRGEIPRSLHCRELNPVVDWARAPCQIARNAQPWQGAERFGGVSAFGIAGTNAHVVLEGAPGGAEVRRAAHAGAAGAPSLLPISARSPEALAALAGRLANLIDSPQAPDVASVAAALARRRTALEHRAALVGSDARALADALRAFARGEAPAHAAGQVAPGHRPMLAFVVPGQGAQWLGMARELLEHDAAFREALVACDTALRPWADWSIVEQLTCAPGSAAYRLERIEVLQPVLVALAIAYAAWLRSVGIEPDAVVGHSMGEVGAAYLAGVLDLSQCMRIIARRSALMQGTSGRGAMALVDLSMDDAQARIAGREAQLSVAVSNSPRSSVISGDPQAVREVIDSLEGEGVFCRLVKVDVASHSPQMQPLAEQLALELADLVPNPARVPIVSTVTGACAEGALFDAAYWARNLRQPVRFAEATRTLLDMGTTVFVELSPHALLSVALQQNGQAVDRDVQVVACGRRDESDLAAAASALASLWVAGVAPDWSRLAPDRAWHVPLPAYPWQRERHWVREAAPAGRRGASVGRAGRAEPVQWEWLHALHWVEAQALMPAGSPSTRRKVLLVGATDGANAAIWRRAFDGEHADVQFAPGLDDARQALMDDAVRPDDWVVLADAVGHPQSLLQLLRPLTGADASGGRPPRLSIATCGAHTVEGHARPATACEQASLWGLGRVLGEEHPELWGGLVDLDPHASAAEQADHLAIQVCRGGVERQVAWRDGQRFALRLQALAESTDTPLVPAWPAEETWLVTGGLGDVALHLASDMVAQGVRRLVMLGRSGLPPRTSWSSTPAGSRDARRIAAVRALEAAGASVHVLVADLGNPGEVEAALAQYAGEGWPAVTCVLHAAGVLETGLATQVTRAAFDGVYDPKAVGALTLDRLLPDAKRFVMISSLSATLGIAGMGSYAAANAVLDALAHARRARGSHGLSIQSGAWIDTGMHSGDSADRNLRQLQDMGIEGHTPRQGVALFDVLAQRPEASVTILPIDWAKFHSVRRGRDLSIFHGRGSIGDAPLGGDPLDARLRAAADPAERRRLTEPVVREAIGKTLKLNPARIDPRKPLGAMGLNSLMAMELRNRLEADLGRALSATLAWNYPTLESLVAFLSAAPGAAAAPQAPAVSATTAANDAPRGIDAVAQLSNDEAARMLRRRR